MMDLAYYSVFRVLTKKIVFFRVNMMLFISVKKIDVNMPNIDIILEVKRLRI